MSIIRTVWHMHWWCMKETNARYLIKPLNVGLCACSGCFTRYDAPTALTQLAYFKVSVIVLCECFFSARTHFSLRHIYRHLTHFTLTGHSSTLHVLAAASLLHSHFRRKHAIWRHGADFNAWGLCYAAHAIIDSWSYLPALHWFP